MKKIIDKDNLLLFLILAITAGCLIYWGSAKEGYHVDEMYMYGTANSEYLPFMHLGPQEYSVKDWMRTYGAGENIADLFRNISNDIRILKANNWDIKSSEIYAAYLTAQKNSNDLYRSGWMSGEDYRNYLAVSRQNRFNYASVYYNFRGDNHPPLYAMLLHTICSVFPGVYSKWFGLSLNILIVTLCALMLYQLVRRFLGDTDIALMSAALYGLSAAAAATSTYIRMYALLTLMVLGMAYAHLRLYEKNWAWDKAERRLLVFFTLCGYLTQYYFVFYAAGIALASCILMLFRRKYKSLLRYIRTMAISAVLGIALWPFSLKAVFSGSRGQQSIQGLFSSGDTGERLGRMLYVLVHESLGIPVWVFLLLSALIIAATFISARPWRVPKTRGSFEKAFLLLLPFCLYFFTVSRMIPYLVDRYIMCILPWPAVFMLCGISFVLKRLPLKQAPARIAIAALFILLLFSSSAFRLGNEYIYTGQQECDEVAEGTDCIYIEPSHWWNESAEDTLLLSRCRNVAVLWDEALPLLAGTYSAEAGDPLLIIVRDDVLENGAELDDIVNTVQSTFPANENIRIKENFRENSRGRWLVYCLAE